MPVTEAEVRSGAYYDSVVLMQLQRSLAALPGVLDAGIDPDGIPYREHADVLARYKETWEQRDACTGSVPDIPNVVMGWDTRPWGRARRGGYIANPTAENFEAACRDAKTRIDAKPYDRRFFNAAVSDDIALHYFEARLSSDTASMANGFPAVCVFVNDELDAGCIARLAEGGVRLIALRCAGFNNVDLKAAQQLAISVVRVPGYSPHAVAEHTMALILTLNRKTHRAYHRFRFGREGG